MKQSVWSWIPENTKGVQSLVYIQLLCQEHSAEPRKKTENVRVTDLVAVVLPCTAELQKSVSVSGSLRAFMQAENGIWARGATGGGFPDDSASSRRRSASCNSSNGKENKNGRKALVTNNYKQLLTEK